MTLKEGKILILDSVQDPGNMGTIIRSSVAFGIDTIVVNEKCADIYSDKVIRSSQGMIFSANIIKENLEEFIEKINKTHKIIVTKVDGGKEKKKKKKKKKSPFIGTPATSPKRTVTTVSIDLPETTLIFFFLSKHRQINAESMQPP